jgi:hypothetical protein
MVGDAMLYSVPGITFRAATDEVLQEKVRPDEDDPLAPQVEKVDGKVVEATGQQIVDRRIEVSQYCEQNEKIDRVEDAKSHVGDGALDRLQFVEVAKHTGYVEIPPALNVQQIVIDIDQDSAYGKKR